MSKRLLLFDFDETYFKHNTNEEDLSHLREMEKLLEKLTNNNEVMTDCCVDRKYISKCHG